MYLIKLFRNQTGNVQFLIKETQSIFVSGKNNQKTESGIKEINKQVIQMICGDYEQCSKSNVQKNPEAEQPRTSTKIRGRIMSHGRVTIQVTLELLDGSKLKLVGAKLYVYSQKGAPLTQGAKVDVKVSCVSQHKERERKS